MLWCLLCITAIASLVIFDSSDSPILLMDYMYQLKSDGSWSTDTPLILYIPNVAWFITSLLCKSSYQCYVKFIPYVRMAAASSGSEDKVSKHKGQKFMHEPLASQPFNSWRFTSAVALIKGRDFVTLFLYLN